MRNRVDELSRPTPRFTGGPAKRGRSSGTFGWASFALTVCYEPNLRAFLSLGKRGGYLHAKCVFFDTVGDLAVVLTKVEAPKLRVVSAVTGQQVSLIDFGDEDGEINFLRDRVIKVAL